MSSTPAQVVAAQSVGTDFPAGLTPELCGLPWDAEFMVQKVHTINGQPINIINGALWEVRTLIDYPAVTVGK